jgi:hypothetical protein
MTSLKMHRKITAFILLSVMNPEHSNAEPECLFIASDNQCEENGDHIKTSSRN